MYSGLDWWLSTCGNAGKDFLFVDRYLKLDVISNYMLNEVVLFFFSFVRNNFRVVE